MSEKASESSLDHRERRELELRRAFMQALPFCPDHRDNVGSRPCRECEIERLRRLLIEVLENDQVEAVFNNANLGEELTQKIRRAVGI